MELWRILSRLWTSLNVRTIPKTIILVILMECSRLKYCSCDEEKRKWVPTVLLFSFFFLCLLMVLDESFVVSRSIHWSFAWQQRGRLTRFYYIFIGTDWRGESYSFARKMHTRRKYEESNGHLNSKEKTTLHACIYSWEERPNSLDFVVIASYGWCFMKKTVQDGLVGIVRRKKPMCFHLLMRSFQRSDCSWWWCLEDKMR